MIPEDIHQICKDHILLDLIISLKMLFIILGTALFLADVKYALL
jgi:hypothetical protein